jgi:hypothetical protein
MARGRAHVCVPTGWWLPFSILSTPVPRCVTCVSTAFARRSHVLLGCNPTRAGSDHPAEAAMLRAAGCLTPALQQAARQVACSAGYASSSQDYSLVIKQAAELSKDVESAPPGEYGATYGVPLETFERKVGLVARCRLRSWSMQTHYRGATFSLPTRPTACRR